jgi:hypothetical protein
MFSERDEVEVVKVEIPEHPGEALKNSSTKETGLVVVSVSARFAFALLYPFYTSSSPANPPIPAYPQAYPNSCVLPKSASK